MEITPKPQTELPLNLAEVLIRGVAFNGVNVPEFRISFKTADGQMRVIESAAPERPQPKKNYPPAVVSKAAEVLAYLKSQARTIQRKRLEAKYQNGERGGQLDAVLSYLKETGQVLSSGGFYTDDAAKFEDDDGE